MGNHDVVEHPETYEGARVEVSGDLVMAPWDPSDGVLFLLWVNDDVNQAAHVVVPGDSAEEIDYYAQGGRVIVEGTITNYFDTEDTLANVVITADLVEGE